MPIAQSESGEDGVSYAVFGPGDGQENYRLALEDGMDIEIAEGVASLSFGAMAVARGEKVDRVFVLFYGDEEHGKLVLAEIVARIAGEAALEGGRNWVVPVSMPVRSMKLTVDDASERLYFNVGRTIGGRDEPAIVIYDIGPSSKGGNPVDIRMVPQQ